MTVRKPDEATPLRWIFSELTPRNVIVAVLAIAGAYCAMQVRMSTFAEQQAEQSRQIEELNHSMTTKLDKEVYATEMQSVKLQLKDISDTVHGINQFLMEHPR